ncbi:hypothetical protein [Labilibaculum euxinus]|uniref:Uncharacterized protein n=1 Tax=Labilibaculum euxinus TaxID=2686357 RepID=A0A7M4D4U2_9BACT|nr:hypothetical protein [Labilibaculum euxinus]MUP37671.1 hypothetical protein [Labilibaculum euxinus]MVB06876.1 hypothetical protein [Labilibaculum euxinus]
MIDSIALGDFKIPPLEIGEISDTIVFEQNTYSFSCLTASKLKIKGELLIQGSKENLSLKINKNGTLAIE